MGFKKHSSPGAAFVLALACIGAASPSVAAPILPDGYVDGPLGRGFGPASYDTCGASDGHGGTAYHCTVTYDSRYSGGDMAMSMTSTNDGKYVGIPASMHGLYYFEVVGPVGPVSVPIHFAASATTSAGSDSFASARVTIGPIALTPPFFGTSALDAAACDASSILFDSYCFGRGAYPTSFGGTYDYLVQANSVGVVQMYINLLALSTASASIDPMISIDATWLASNPGYSVIFSPNAGGTAVTEVPEPISLAMFGAGLAGTMAMRRRRKVNAA